MKYVYILKTGNTFENTKSSYGDFEDWIINNFDRKKFIIKTINTVDEKLPNINRALGFIITGSHAMVSDNNIWSLNLEKYIKKIVKRQIPLLGICFGHQLIAKALGGNSDYNKKNKEIGSVKILLKDQNSDLILKEIPKKFYAYETHYQSVLKLPPNTKVLAKNSHDKHQILKFGKYCWGVQFHPEFNKIIMKEYVDNQIESINKLGLNLKFINKNIRNCDISSKILENFGKIVLIKRVN